MKRESAAYSFVKPEPIVKNALAVKPEPRAGAAGAGAAGNAGHGAGAAGGEEKTETKDEAEVCVFMRVPQCVRSQLDTCVSAYGSLCKAVQYTLESRLR